MADIRVKDSTIANYKEARARLRQKLGTSRVTQALVAMNDEQLHDFANDLLALLDITDPILDR